MILIDVCEIFNLLKLSFKNQWFGRTYSCLENHFIMNLTPKYILVNVINYSSRIPISENNSFSNVYYLIFIIYSFYQNDYPIKLLSNH